MKGSVTVTEAAERLIAQIREAFRDVALGSGTGLWEAQAIDDYGDDDDRAKARERDEKHDWQSIPWEVLGPCESSLSFFDAEGMRFHLPAFMIADVQGHSYADGVLYSLISGTPYMLEKYSLLDAAQRRCVASYLRWHRDTSDFDRSEIERALQEYWKVESE